jgi:hypothetical protein
MQIMSIGILIRAAYVALGIVIGVWLIVAGVLV